MGAASYNRGTRVVRRGIDATTRPAEFELMERLNAAAKDPRAVRPFGPVHFAPGHGGWWATCPVTGFGFWYGSLVAAVRRWRVVIVAFENGTWISEVN